MQSEEIIQSLTERIGFGSPQGDSSTLQLSEAILSGTSGRTFKSFHQLVTIENIVACMYNDGANSEEINNELEDFRNQAVLEIVPLILDKHPDYIPLENYDNRILENITLFDDAIGYKVAIMVIQMFMSTNRSNIVERNAKLSVSNLKLELEGYRNDSGVLVAQGLVHKFSKSIKDASDKIFPFKVVVKDGNAW